MGVLDGPPHREGSRGPSITRASIILYSIACFFVALRLYTRHCIAKTHGIDDAFIIMALIFVTVQTVAMIMQVAWGWGEHVWEMSLEQMNKTQFWRYIFAQMWYFALWSIKMSISWLCLRMAAGATTFGSRYRIVVRSFMGLLTARLVVSFFVSIFQCYPISNYWHLEIRPANCIDIPKWQVATSSMNTITDIILFFLPMPIIYKLQMLVKQRFALFCIFSTGLIPVIASVIRMAYIIESSYETGGMTANDASWRWGFVPFWSEIESTVGIIAACLPTLNPLLKRLAHRVGLRSKTLSTPGDSNTFSSTNVFRGNLDSTLHTAYESNCSASRPTSYDVRSQMHHLTPLSSWAGSVDEGPTSIELSRQGILMTRDVDVRRSNSSHDSVEPTKTLSPSGSPVDKYFDTPTTKVASASGSYDSRAT